MKEHMTIEITRGKSAHQFRINAYAPTEIDYRKNQHNARWLFHSRYPTPQEALAALWEIERAATPPRQEPRP